MKPLLQTILNQLNANPNSKCEVLDFYEQFNDLPREARGKSLAEMLQEIALGRGERRTVKQEAERWLETFGLKAIPNQNLPNSIFIVKKQKTNGFNRPDIELWDELDF